jgi:putative membrane protein
MMNDWAMTGWGWGWMSFWALLGIVLIATLVAAALRTSPISHTPADAAMTELRQRYAAGEIDDTEFEKRRAVLER